MLVSVGTHMPKGSALLFETSNILISLLEMGAEIRAYIPDDEIDDKMEIWKVVDGKLQNEEGKTFDAFTSLIEYLDDIEAYLVELYKDGIGVISVSDMD